MNVPGVAECLIQRDREGDWLLFTAPRAVHVATRLDQVMFVLDQVVDAVERESLWAAGFISYEAAPGFDANLRVRTGTRTPLLWFALYGAPTIVPAAALARLRIAQQSAIPDWQVSLSRREFAERVQRIRQYIAAGDNYQTNFTLRLETPLLEAPWQLFLRMCHGHASRCGAYVDAGDFVVASASPELLLRMEGDDLVSRPMKGTAPRGRLTSEDRACGDALRASEKNCAENLMIVDMVRNDMSRVATLGSVRTEALFAVERYPSLLTLTSTVRARSSAGIGEVLRAMFPAASITGAPKRRTMQIIAELESTPRGVYTGSVGFIAPNRRAQFNVAIRTAVVERGTRTVEFGVGGGIVWDSTSAGEYDECLLKARVVTQAPREFELLETLRWQPDMGFVLLDRHLDRLLDSAHYFDFFVDVAAVRERLMASIAGMSIPLRVRLLLARAGEVSVAVQSLEGAAFAAPSQQRGVTIDVALADAAIDAQDVFLLHKTTQRAAYDACLATARARHGNIADVVLWNGDGEITESTIANVVVEIDGMRCTPPVECGLLAGTLRAELLAQGLIEEARVTVRDIRERATRVWLINSVRGWREVRIV